MNYRCIQQSVLIAAMACLSSCAYIQTHKNIEEAGRQHAGYHLNSPLKLYKGGGQYYLQAEQQQLRIHYPAIHDSIFLNQNNALTLTRTSGETSNVYFPISKGTGEVMQLQNGYVELETLKDELLDGQINSISSLPAGAHECTIRSTVQGEPVTWLAPAASEPGTNTGTAILSTLDKVLVDWPGTVLYNLAIPVMAPFVFFHQFLNEE